MSADEKQKIGRLKKAIFFIWRQIYKVFVVFPFQLAIEVAGFFTDKKYVGNDIPQSFCFIITSMIYIKQGKIEYGSQRSLFGPEERAKQTLNTISSIHQKVPGAKTVLIEGGLEERLPFDLQDKVDQYIYVGKSAFVRRATDSVYKSFGEVAMLTTGLKLLKINSDFYFKISGRYYLDEGFNIKNWLHKAFVLKYLKNDYVCTRLYGFHAAVFNVWKRAIVKSIPLAAIGYAVENTLAKYIHRDKVYELSILGVTGIGGSNNAIMKD